jgi:conjugal transfer/entry exclusion protein
MSLAEITRNPVLRIVKETNNIQVIENFIKKYNNYSKHIEEAKQRIIEIEAQQEQEKLQKIEQEIEEKWNSIQKLDKKLQKSAIEAFLKKYPNSKFNQEANKLLDELSTPTTTKKGIEELNVVKDSKQFKKILDDNKENLNENKELIKQNAIRVFNSLKGKKQKNFFKEIQLARFLDNNFEEEVKKCILTK